MPNKYETRNSPNVSAQDYKNLVKEGNDGNYYLSKSDKNGIYRWYKIKTKEETKSALEFYSQFPGHIIKYDLKELKNKLKIAAKELKKHNIFYIEVGWDLVWEFIDYAESDAMKILNTTYKEYLDKEYENYLVKNKLRNSKDNRRHFDNIIFFDVINYMFTTDLRYYRASIDGILDILWHTSDKNSRKIIQDTFQSVFGNRLIFPKSKNKTIQIKLQKL